MVAQRWSEARRLADEIAPRTPAELAGKHLLVARGLAGQGRLSEALDHARSAAGVLPDELGPALAVAGYAAAAGDLGEAITALRHAATLRGAPGDGFANRIVQLEEQREAERSRSLMRRALDGADR
jgi:hypothetical protein